MFCFTLGVGCDFVQPVLLNLITFFGVRQKVKKK